MQIREKGGKWYLLRSSYDPSKKRSVQAVIGSGAYSGRLSLHDGIVLTPEEEAQWAAHIKPLNDRSTLYRLKNLPASLEEYLKAVPEYLPADLVDEHINALAETLKALRKHKKRIQKGMTQPQEHQVPLPLEEGQE